jgi:type VI secretion system secreted protein Hcp
MALNAFLHLKGQKQGDIKGSVTQKGREGSIMVIAANHEISSPLGNTASGAAVGKRVHKPFVITKELDKSSPLLYQAMVNNELMAGWKLDFFAAAANGVEKQDYSVVLTNAIITDIKFVLPNTKDTDTMKLNPCEMIEFSYQSIQWTWIEGALTATDKWM